MPLIVVIGLSKGQSPLLASSILALPVSAGIAISRPAALDIEQISKQFKQVFHREKESSVQRGNKQKSRGLRWEE